MSKPEGETTRVLRNTMDLNLDEVNTELIAAGEKAIDATTLRKRRAWVRAKDSGKRTKAKSSAGKPLKKKAKGKVAKAGRKLFIEPRRGTFTALVYGLPYDMDADEVMRRAKAAGVEGQKATIYKVRAKYPKATAKKLNPIASTDSLRQQDAAARKQLALTPVQASREAGVRSAKHQFVLCLMRLGLDAAEALMQDYKRAHDQLEATLIQG
jgi:hypothetical protein